MARGDKSAERADPEPPRAAAPEPERVEVVQDLPPQPGQPLERSKVAWLLYLIVQHLLWLFAALRESRGPAAVSVDPSKGPE